MSLGTLSDKHKIVGCQSSQATEFGDEGADVGSSLRLKGERHCNVVIGVCFEETTMRTQVLALLAVLAAMLMLSCEASTFTTCRWNGYNEDPQYTRKTVIATSWDAAIQAGYIKPNSIDGCVKVNADCTVRVQIIR